MQAPCGGQGGAARVVGWLRVKELQHLTIFADQRSDGGCATGPEAAAEEHDEKGSTHGRMLRRVVARVNPRSEVRGAQGSRVNAMGFPHPVKLRTFLAVDLDMAQIHTVQDMVHDQVLSLIDQRRVALKPEL